MPVSSSITSYEGSKTNLIAGGEPVTTSYTVDYRYVTEMTLPGSGDSRKIVEEGQVMSIDPSNRKIVPNYSAYGFTAIGVNIQDVDVTDGDEALALVWDGHLSEPVCIDNGTLGTVLAATKTALTDRITFTRKSRV
jgi:hypothetical protein